MNWIKNQDLDIKLVIKTIIAETDALHKNYKDKIRSKITLPIVQMPRLLDEYAQLDLYKALNWSGNPAV